jgi:trigger factor
VKSTVETLSPTRVRLAVDVPFDELKPSLDKAYKSIAKQIRVPGFRPGKAPAAVINQRIGQAAVLQEAASDAVSRAYAEALRSNEVRPLGQPDIEVTKVDTGEGISFTAEVDVRPQVTLPPYDALAVTVDDVTVTEEQVDNRVDVLRQKFAMLRTVDRPAADGDYVNIDLTAEVDGEEIENRTGLSYQVGSGDLVEGLDEALAGLGAEEQATFTTNLVGGEEAGRTASVTVTVRSVKEKEVPELDDEFAQSASEFETLAELRADLRGKIEKLKKTEQGFQARERVLEALLAATDMPLPESLVSSEQDFRRSSLEAQLSSAGTSLEEYLEGQEQSSEDFDADLRSTAERVVKTQLVLDALADAEQVAVSEEELTEHVVLQAERYGVAPEEFARRLGEAGSLPALVAEVRRNKALSAVLDAATITDESGDPVDVNLLRRGQTAPSTTEVSVTEVAAIEVAETAGDAAGDPDTAGTGDAAAEPAADGGDRAGQPPVET